ncbi:MAG TPA: Calx-beta domain-containing protein, partial [Vicinamibacterales bacterium]|nr:Calx-beta domain-containing protein [Vicinamibacterales bacterium]
LDWRVTGSGGAVTVTQRASIDGNPFCTCSMSATAGQAYRSSCSQPWTATAGNHTITWQLDYANSVVESNESNNSKSVSFISTTPPTLTTSVATVASGSPVTVTLKNGLGGAMDWMALALSSAPNTSYVQYVYVGSGVVNRTWTFNAPASPGPYEVRLFQNDGFVRLATSPIISVVPGLSIGDVSLDEGQSGITTAFFNVTLSAPSTQVVSVSYATSNGTATAGSDYVGTSGSLNFSPGVTSLVIPVTINGDVVFEPNETFTVTLSNPLNAILSNATAIGTIRADDGGPTLAIDDVSVVEGDSGTVTALFTVTLSPAAAGNVTVDFVTANGTATAGSDYTARSGTLAFAPGQQSQTIAVTVTGDTVAESNETFFVDLSNASVNSVIGDGHGIGTIINDEGPRLTVNTSIAASGAPVTVTLANAPGGATDWITLAAVGAPEQTYLLWTYVGSGLTTRNWTVPMPPVPGQYEFRFYLNNSFTRTATSAPVTVRPGMTISDASIAEGNSGTVNLAFTVNLSAPSPGLVSVQYATGGGTATAGTDYTATSGTLTFAPNQVSMQVLVPVIGDVTFEPTETLSMSLSNAANAIITDADGIGTIVNDDLGPTLTINDVSVLEGDSGTVNAVFTVTLNPVAANVTVDYATANLSAIAPGDYAATSGTLIFPGNTSSQTITVVVNGDLLQEPNETFAVNLSNVSFNAAIGDPQGVGTIVNDEGPRLTPNVTSAPANGPVTVSLNNTPGGATDWVVLAPAGAPDATYLNWTYVGAGVTSRTWTINMPPIPGQYEFRLFANNTFTRLATSAPVNVLPGISVNDVAIAEGNAGSTNAVFTLTLSAPGSQPITVQYATADGTATSGSDYTAVSNTATFAPGVTTVTISVPVSGDVTFEQTETFTLGLSNPTNAVISDNTGIGTIQNDDLGPTLSVSDAALVEGDSGSSLMTFSVSLSPAGSGNVSVNYATADQTANAGSDYTAASGTLFFGAGETLKTFTVPVIGDTTREANETFLVNLSNSSVNAAIGDGQGIGTITNDDGPRITVSSNASAPGLPVTFELLNGLGGPTDWLALAPAGSPNTTYVSFVYVGAGVTTRTWTVNLPQAPLGGWEARLFENNTYNRLATSPQIVTMPGVSISDVAIDEGNSGNRSAAFVVTLSGPSSSPITMQYATVDGTAVAPGDYIALSGNLTFNPGVVQQLVQVPIISDTNFEPNENFTVVLSNPANALLTDATGLGTIKNDDAGPTLSINDVSLNEGDSGSSLMTFTVSLLPASSGNVTVDYATANQTAVAGSDYTTTAGTLVFAPGDTSKTFTVAILGDLGAEPNETFRVDLSNASITAAIGDGVGIGTIISDDGPRIVPSVSSAAPGTLVTFTLNNSPGGPTDWLALAPANAPDTTYTQFVYVGAGITSRNWTVAMPMAPLGPWEARLFENNTYNRIATSAAVNVAPGLSVNDVTIAEGNSGSSVATFTVTLSGPSSQAIAVQYATSNGTATAGSDYTATSGTLTLNPGVVSQTFGVSISGDVTFEPNETFTVTLSNPSGALLTDAAGIGTISNDDAGPTLAINDVSLAEGDSGSTPMTFTVSLLPASSGNVTVDYATVNQTALAGSDYTAASGTVVFAPGETSKTLTVAILGDLGGEPNETFRVDLSNANLNAVIGDAFGIGTIINDDGPRIFPSAASSAPGGAVTFTLNNSPGGPTDWLALAPAGAPDTTYSTYVYVGAGVTSRAWTVNMPVAPLGLWEARLFENNTFNRLATSTPVNVQAGLSVNDVTIAEGNAGASTVATFTVTLSGASTQPITVQYATSNDTATAGSDYAATSGTLTFNPGIVSQTFGVSISGDVTFEPNETFIVTLSNPTGALLTDATGIGTITNDDAGPTLSINDVSLVEGDSGSTPMTFTVSLLPAASGNVTVNYVTANQTALAGSDYTSTSGAIVFAPGETSKTFTVGILGDPGFEPNETFRVDLSNASVGAAIGDGLGIGTIINDDGPRIVPSVASVAPGGAVTFTLNNSPGGPLDWMALAPVGSADTAYVSYIYVGAGVTSRAWTVNMPLAPLGSWEVRLLENNGYNRLATSTPVQTIPGLSISDVTIDEGNSGNRSAAFVVSLAGPTSQVVTVQYATSDGTAASGSDYIGVSGSLTFNPGVMQQTVQVPILTDTNFEPNENFSIVLSNPANALLTDAIGIGTIQNDDAGPALSINDVSLNEGDSGSRLMTFTVTLSPASSGNVSVDYATANQTATAGSDYTATSGTLIYPPGQTSKTFTVAILGDPGTEPNETFRVDLSNVNGSVAIADGVGVGTIINDDGPRLTVSAGSAATGEFVNVLLSNSPGGAQDWIALAPSSAPNESYVAYTYVGAGVTSRNWTVAAPNAAGPYEFRLFLDNGFTRAATSAVLNVLPVASVQANVDVNEGNSGTANAIFNVTLSAASASAVTVTYSTADVTATAGSDYSAASGTLTFPAGATLRTISVPIIGDTTVESSETFTVTLSNPTNAALGTVTRTGTIINDDSAGPCADSDGDRLCNAFETNTGVYVSALNTGTSPNVADTDGDGILDGDEVLGTLAGLDLPGMGASPVKKNILFEYDWFDDTFNDPGVNGDVCGAHTHRPTAAMIARVSASFAASPLTNPDGTTGITLIHDYGQGGGFTGGSLVAHAPNVTGGVDGVDFINTKNANFAANRNGYFHYVMMGHWYTDALGSSGQAELPGDDLIVTLGCFNSTNNGANTIMHEAGHNFNIRHGGNENCNWKPNYNSVMNYRFQFPGVDTSCNAIGNSGESNVLDYSRGVRIPLNENALNENGGTCGATPIDWNFSGTFTSGLVYDLNRNSSNPTAATPVENFGCAANLQTLNDHNDWANMSFTGLTDGDGNSILGLWLYYAKELLTETNSVALLAPGVLVGQQQ